MKIAHRELHITTSRKGVPWVRMAFLTSVIPKTFLFVDTDSVCLFNLLRGSGKSFRGLFPGLFERYRFLESIVPKRGFSS